MIDETSLAEIHPGARLVWLADRARQRIVRELERRLRRDVGISVAQAGGLIVIGEYKQVAMRTLAEALDIGQPAVTGLVRRMEDRDLVRRLHDAKDARVQRLMLTATGRAARKKAINVLNTFNDRIEGEIPEIDRPAVFRFLEQSSFDLEDEPAPARRSRAVARRR
ncbi:MAG: MarR family winged helix-turn-helix transcriptional regulator [Alphaproteobacteria bacterium]